jgi:RNA polymerase sigma-70 factor (ECF subfamily)
MMHVPMAGFALAVPLLAYTVVSLPRRVLGPPATQTRMSTLPQHQYQPDEQDLIRRVAEGDKAAFYELVRPYTKAIYLAAKSVLENEADAEDAAQEAVLKAFTHIQSFRGDSKFGTWLYQITLNEARAKLRKQHRDLYEHLDAPTADEQGDYWPSDYADWRHIPSDALELRQLREALSKALSSLEPKYRQVLLLRDVQHLSAAETAELLGISEENVRTRLHRARLRMRDALAPGFDGAWTKGRSWQVIRTW